MFIFSCTILFNLFDFSFNDLFKEILSLIKLEHLFNNFLLFESKLKFSLLCPRFAFVKNLYNYLLFYLFLSHFSGLIYLHDLIYYYL